MGVMNGFIAFISFCFCASAVYIANDLSDAEDDRKHPVKRHRPIAAYRICEEHALLLIYILSGFGLVISFLSRSDLNVVLCSYLLVSLGYILWARRQPLIDAFTLAALYVIRLVAGHEATGIPYSTWLLMFCLFTFLGLAFLKRFVDFSGRKGYGSFDGTFISESGIASGFISVLVLALYVDGRNVSALYDKPEALLVICPILLYWTCRMWFLANRGRMNCDPVLFAVKDPLSYAVAGIALVIIWWAAN
jgi:4-hydroxybenzoate polyprenyltransferase